MTAEVIAHMRGRVKQLQYLASHVNDGQTVQVLRQMCDEIEADIRKLEAQGQSPFKP